MPAVASAVLPANARSAVASLPWRMQRQHHLTVIAKATFALVDGGEMSVTAPQPILLADVHHRNNPGRSARWTSDMAPYLPLADVLFTGLAFPPPGGQTTEIPIRLAVFSGDRAAVDKRLIVRDAAGVAETHVQYEAAFGGIGVADNPYGTHEPKIMYPGHPDRVAGFAPIGRAWHVRKRLLGSTPRQVVEAPVPEFPETFDWSYFQSAPPDQRMSHLDGGEWIVLEGLHPTLPVLRSKLPGARALARVYGLSAVGLAEGLPLELRADTLRIDGALGQCTVVWRRSFPVASEALLARVRVVAGVELPGAPIDWSVAALGARPSPTAASSVDEKTGETMDISDDDIESVDVSRTLSSDTLDGPGDDDRALPLPFRTSWSPPAMPEARPPVASVGTGTLTLSDEAEPFAPGPLPFRGTSSPPAPAVAIEAPPPPIQEPAVAAPEPAVAAPEPAVAAPEPPPETSKSPWGTAYDVTRTPEAPAPASKAASKPARRLDVVARLYGSRPKRS